MLACERTEAHLKHHGRLRALRQIETPGITRELARGALYAVEVLLTIAGEQRKVGLGLRRKFLVSLQSINAGHEITDVEAFKQMPILG